MGLVLNSIVDLLKLVLLVRFGTRLWAEWILARRIKLAEGVFHKLHLLWFVECQPCHFSGFFSDSREWFKVSDTTLLQDLKLLLWLHYCELLGWLVYFQSGLWVVDREHPWTLVLLSYVILKTVPFTLTSHNSFHFYAGSCCLVHWIWPIETDIRRDTWNSSLCRFLLILVSALERILFLDRLPRHQDHLLVSQELWFWADDHIIIWPRLRSLNFSYQLRILDC